MNPEHEAIIIREHARLREEILALRSKQYVNTEETWIRREDVLALLHPVEHDKTPERRYKAVS